MPITTDIPTSLAVNADYQRLTAAGWAYRSGYRLLGTTYQLFFVCR